MPTAAPILAVLAGHEGLTPTDRELLTLARRLGVGHAVWPGSGSEAPAELCALHGASATHVLAGGSSDSLSADSTAALVAAVAREVGANVVLLASGPSAREVAALSARLLGAGLVLDASEIRIGADDHVSAVRSALSATWDVHIHVKRPAAVVTVAPNSVTRIEADDARAARLVEHAVDIAQPSAVTVIERHRPDVSEGPDLARASVVVAGGRGTNGDFRAVRELAELLGGAVGSTRVATDEGWIAPATQIGQTGLTVAPRLYIGAGVSGAVHHRGGMQAAGTIVAINTDREAPIFEIADVGVVGDLHTVLPQLTAELRRRRG